MLLQGLLYAVTTVPPSSHTCACCADVQVLAPESCHRHAGGGPRAGWNSKHAPGACDYRPQVDGAASSRPLCHTPYNHTPMK